MNPSSPIEKHFVLQPILYAVSTSTILFSLLSLTALIGPHARHPLSSGRHPEPNAGSQVVTHKDGESWQL
jgi:hypothetical protein